jgi:cyanophycinase
MINLLRLITILFTILLLAVLPSLVNAKPGCAVPIGGALKADNTEVWSRLVALSGGKGATWLVVPTASSSPEKSAAQIIASLQAQGAKAEMLPLSTRLAGNDVTAIVRDTAWLNKIKNAKGIYFAGGAQERITAALYEKDAKNGDGTTTRTPMLDAMWAMFEAGGVVAGSSAGAAIMSETMFREPPEILTIMREGAMRGIDIALGLGFAGKDIFVDQHFLKRGRIGRMLPVMLQEGIARGLGVEENTAAIICGDTVEVIGARGVLFADTRNANKGAVFQAFTPFAAKNISLTYLDRGDKMNLQTGLITVSAAKQKGTLLDHTAAGFKPYNTRVRFYPDMLGDSMILNAMSELVDSPATETRGLAFSVKDLKDSNIGFEFRLFKTADTRGYFTSAAGGEDYSIIRMGLDVMPVKFADPLYQPLTIKATKTGENASSAKSGATEEKQK